jgi:predicted transposase YdaD
MSLPFDATLKDLVSRHTADFVRAFGLPRRTDAHVMNVDLSTLSAATDIVLGYGDPPDSLVDLNFQSASNAGLPDRTLMYNAVLRHQYHVPVRSVVVLLRQAADHPTLTGRVDYHGRGWGTVFRYQLVRLWQVPAQRLLRGGAGSMPLAVLGRLPEGVETTAGLADVVRQTERRLGRIASHEDATQLLTASFVLTGLRIPREVAIELFRGMRAMRESTTYQYILDEGRIEGMRASLLRLGRQRFGSAADAETAVNGITDLERLERMTDRVLRATDWQDLLATP